MVSTFILSNSIPKTNHHSVFANIVLWIVNCILHAKIFSKNSDPQQILNLGVQEGVGFTSGPFTAILSKTLLMFRKLLQILQNKIFLQTVLYSTELSNVINHPVFFVIINNWPCFCIKKKQGNANLMILCDYFCKNKPLKPSILSNNN